MKQLINDTLKRKDAQGNLKWSATRLTMATAWFTAVGSYLYDLTKNGFHFEAFIVIVGVALGSKISDGIGKKLNPETDHEELS